jgi:DNA invertase Pin-like site-specific DNA recombinase
MNSKESGLKISDLHLQRRAVVYVRQSTLTQLQHNLESQRRQYGLAGYARDLGFAAVETVDEDLGRSGSGLVERPGFQRLVAMVCTGEVGAVFCIEASRLARNGRDWHHLIDLCGLVGALVIDPEGVYDPRSSNDRLLLGLKGTMSEFELNLLRQRSLQAILQKAGRGDLRFELPVGLCWTRDGRIELDADRRVQHAIRMVFDKFVALGSARQVLLWCRQNRVLLPRRKRIDGEQQTEWILPIYGMVIKLLWNPLYAGAYVFGKTESRLLMHEGRAQKTAGHRKAQEKWTVLLHDHHPSYISWERYQRNQTMLFENAHMKKKMSRSASRGGQSLLAGLMRCRRCGRMLHVTYSGTFGTVPRYHCRGAHVNHGGDRCISIGGLRVDEAASREILRVVEPHALDAAIQAAENLEQRDAARHRALQLELEQARYQARLAERRYEAADPENRLVAGELEARWNAELQRITQAEDAVNALRQRPKGDAVDREALMRLAQDLPHVWRATTDRRVKQQIARTLLVEVAVDVDEVAREVELIFHWVGGRHSEVRLPKNQSGFHRRTTNADALAVIQAMAGRFDDATIAATLNRLKLKTGHDNTWIESRVRSARLARNLPNYDPANRDESKVTLQEAAKRLGVSPTAVRHLLEDNILSGEQVVPCAPWMISTVALAEKRVLDAVIALKAGKRRPRTQSDDQQTLDFTSLS